MALARRQPLQNAVGRKLGVASSLAYVALALLVQCLCMCHSLMLTARISNRLALRDTMLLADARRHGTGKTTIYIDPTTRGRLVSLMRYGAVSANAHWACRPSSPLLRPKDVSQFSGILEIYRSSRLLLEVNKVENARDEDLGTFIGDFDMVLPHEVESPGGDN